ncbi:MAG TPA: Wzz/FepE/Etk N-terminal domain-containing protein [Oscillospiraceae bacterium]|nr:Wzz/FepE/Etk N-terminal domain-containing protein [Oscillospiraceae bacterium]HPS35723.1 Wzz/FepE/Etk N-terminal domain-containing protein [Oscillospiraceae bacterium]
MIEAIKPGNNRQEETEIDLLVILKLLKKRIWIIIVAVILCSGIALGYTRLFVKPSYQAGVMIYVNNSSISVGGASFSISDAQISAAYKLVDTYLVILKARSTLEKVIQLANTDYTYEQLLKMVEGEAVDSTEIFRVRITSHSPVEAALLANTVAQVLPQRISEIVVGSSVKIVDNAVIPTERISPSYTKNTAIGFLIGLVLSTAYIIINNLLDTRITSKDYLTQSYNIPVIGIIPDIHEHSDDEYSYYYRSRKASPKTKAN